MKEEKSDDYEGLLDDDPALDFILYKEMVKEDRSPRKKDGCLTLILLMSVPPAAFYHLLQLLA